MLVSSTGSPLPMIIQGGMGIGVSDWRLARAVSLRGQLGVVSATAIDSVFVRRLQDGDAAGTSGGRWPTFPMPEVAADCSPALLPSEGGRPAGAPYRMLAHVSARASAGLASS